MNKMFRTVMATLTVCAAEPVRVPMTMLLALHEFNVPVSANEVANKLGIERNTVSQQLSRLVASGLLERTKRAYRNGWMVHLYRISPQGNLYLMRMVEKIHKEVKKGDINNADSK